MRKLLLLASLALLGAGCASVTAGITTFEECAAAGNPIMESYPRQCRAGGKTFVEIVAVPPTPPSAAPGPVPEPAEPSQGEATEGEYGKPVTLTVGATATYEGGVSVTLVRIDDSRCPKGVVCVWAGELAPVLSVRAAGAAAVEVPLGTTTRKTGRVGLIGIELAEATETAATIVVTK
jgi:hypothetical protein